MRILIIEDEKNSARLLAQEIEKVLPRGSYSIETAASFDAAWNKIRNKKFDVIFTDLLLLPRNCKIHNSMLVCGHNAKRFSSADWNKYVVERGGVELIRRARNRIESYNKDTAIVVISWFDDLVGFKRILRMIRYGSDRSLSVIPKIRSTDSVDLSNTINEFFRSLFNEIGRNIYPDLTSLEPIAVEVRALVKDLRLMRIRRIRQNMGLDPLDVQPLIAGIAGELILEVDPTNDPYLCSFLYSSKANEHYPYSALYEDWSILRDRILMNPNIDLAISLRIKRGHGRYESQKKLMKYTSTHRVGFGVLIGPDPIPEDMSITTRLIERSLLTYLAYASEPMQSVDEGWAVSLRELGAALNNIEQLKSQPYVRNNLLKWPDSQTGIPIIERLTQLSRQGAILDYIVNIRNEIQGALNVMKTYEQISAKSILVSYKNKRTGRDTGYYFNGDFSIVMPKSEYSKLSAHRVALFSLHRDIVFECLDNAKVGPWQIPFYLEDAGIDTKFIPPVNNLEKLEEVLLAEDLSDRDLVIISPVDNEMLNTFMTQKWLSIWEELIGKKNRLALLVLNSDVRALSKEELSSLQNRGVDCMYPTSRQDNFSVTKLIDHIICSSYRTKYLARRVEERLDSERLDTVATLFRDIVSFIDALGYDGPNISGSLSMRASGDQFYVTSSRTNKRNIKPDNISLVKNYSITYNVLDYAGNNKPSSSSPWHSLIYQIFPNVKFILHTHWKRLTRHPNLEKYSTDVYVPSGSQRLAADVTQKLLENYSREMRKGFVILKDHGEAFIADSAQELRRLVKFILEEVEE